MSVGAMTPKQIKGLGGETLKQGLKLASNGALIDTATGRIVGMSDPPHPAADTRITTTERAQELAYIRHHAKRQEHVLAAVRRATGDKLGTVFQEFGDADGFLHGVIAEEVVLNPLEKGIDRARALQMLDEQLGADGRAPKQAANVPSNGIQINIGADVAAQVMAQLMAQAQQRGILDAE